MSRAINPFGLRMPQGVRDLLEHEAEKSGRSLNAEIVHRLEKSLRTTVPHEWEIRTALLAHSELMKSMAEVFQDRLNKLKDLRSKGTTAGLRAPDGTYEPMEVSIHDTQKTLEWAVDEAARITAFLAEISVREAQGNAMLANEMRKRAEVLGIAIPVAPPTAPHLP